MSRLSRFRKSLDHLDVVVDRWFEPYLRAAEREARTIRALERFLEVIPESRRQVVFDMILTSAWDDCGLRGVYNLIEWGRWDPTPIPEVVVDAYLRWPRAELSNHCRECKLPLPTLSGFWRNTDTGGRWQAPLNFWKSCPCGGVIVHGDGRPVEIFAWLPDEPTGPWEFSEAR